LTEIACDESGNPPNLKQIKWKKGRENREKKKKKPTNRPKPPFSLDIFERRKMLDNFDLLQHKKKIKK